MIASPRHLAQQLARYAAAQTGRTFVEAAATSPGHHYAASMPLKAHRLSPGVSWTLEPAPGPADDEPLVRRSVRVACRAATPEAALEELGAIRDALYPGGEPICAPLVRDVIGAPALLAGASAAAWRIVTLEVAGEPELTSLGSGPSATAAGEAEAGMLLDVLAHPVTLTRAGDIVLDNSSPISGTATLQLNVLTLTQTPDGQPQQIDEIPLDGQTIGEVFSGITAIDNFSATLEANQLAGEPASQTLLGFETIGVIQTFIGVPLYAATT